MKKVTIGMIILILELLLWADAVLIWDQVYGGEYSDGARAVIPALDGGFILVGYTYSMGGGNSDILLIKTDEQGNEIWTHTYGGSGWEYGYSVCPAFDSSGYVIAGYTTSFGNGARDVFVIGTDIEGNQLWSGCFGGEDVDVGFSIIQGHNQDYVICGYTFSQGVGEDDIYVLGLDQEGNEIWSSVLGCPRTDQGYTIRKTTSGNYIIAGMTGLYDTPGVTSGRNSEIYLLEIDQEGTVISENTFWGIDNDQGDFDEGISVCQMNDGGYCIIGGATAEGVEVMDLVVIKTDAELTEEWKEVFEPGDFYDFGKCVYQSEVDGNILICGVTRYSQPLTNDVFVMKLNLEGEIIFSGTFGTAGSESGYHICEDENGNFLIAGQKDDEGNGNYDAWLILISGVTADFEANPKTGISPQNVDFQDNSTGLIDGWNWDFNGDGIFDSTEQNPSFLYEQPGTYTVILEVEFNEYTVSCVKEDYINIFDSDSALQYDQSDSYSVCAANPILNLTDDFTIEAWVVPQNWGNFFNKIVDKGVISVFMNESFPVYNPYCLVVQMSHDNEILSRCYTPENSVLPTGTQHIAVTYNGVDNIMVFINGIEQDLTYLQEPEGQLQDNIDLELYIGNDATGTYNFNGIIDELRIWDYARTGDQINEMMLYYLTGTEIGLISYLNFNEGNGTQFCDLTGNLEPGSIHNANWVQGVILIQTPTEENLLMPGPKLTLENYPNPFNPSTTFTYYLSKKGNVELKIFNLKGQLVDCLFSGHQNSGNHSIVWNNSELPSGIYYACLRCDKKRSSRKIMFFK